MNNETRHTVITNPTRIGNTWHFEDGTILPVVSGGSDLPPAGAPTAAPPAEPPRAPNGQFQSPGVQQPLPGLEPPVVVPTGQQVRTFTAEEIEAARTQERNKLYPKIETLEQEVARLAEADAERQRLAQEAEEARLRAEEAERTAELSAQERVAEVEATFTQKLRELEEQQEKDRVLFEMEQKYAQVRQYAHQALAANAENIMPQLRDLVVDEQGNPRGGSNEEIDTLVAAAVAKTASIMEDVAAAQGANSQYTQQQARGTTITSPVHGPMDTQTGQQTLTPEQLRDMPMADYIQNRERLLGAASRQASERGLYS